MEGEGIKRTEAEKGQSRRVWLPITPQILRALKRVWDSRADDPDVVMVWAACCVGFFGFFRAGEMTVPSDHLSYRDISMDNPRDPQMVRIWIKQSKTDPFQKGIGIYLGKTSSDLCLVTALLKFLTVRKKGRGPFPIPGWASPNTPSPSWWRQYRQL